MNKRIDLHFNKDGILTSHQVDEIRQGDKGVEVNAYFEEKQNFNFIARLNFTRPDGKHNDNVIMLPDNIDKTKYTKQLESAWYFAKNGEITLTVFLTDSSANVLANGQVTIAVQKTDYSDDPTITPDEYAQLLAAIQSKLNIQDAIISVNQVVGEATDYNEGQAFFEKSTGNIRIVENGAFQIKTNLYNLLYSNATNNVTNDFKLLNNAGEGIENILGLMTFTGDFKGNLPTLPFYKNITTLREVVTNSKAVMHIFCIEDEATNFYCVHVKNEGGVNRSYLYAFDHSGYKTVLVGGSNLTKTIAEALEGAHYHEYADKEYVAEEISLVKEQLGAHKLSKNAEGDNFETESELLSATTFYYRGQVHTPDENDFAIVNKYGDDPDNLLPARFSFDGVEWNFDFILTELTKEQQEALNSGINSTKVAKIEANEQAIGELADLVNVIKLYVGTKELEDGTEIPDLSDIRQIEPTQKTYSFREVYEAITNKKHVKIVATYPDSSRYIHDISNVSENSITLTLDEGVVVDYFEYAGEVTEEVHKIGEGGGTGTVKKINGVDPDEQGEVTLTGENIALDETENVTVRDKILEVEQKAQDAKESAEGKTASYWLSYKSVPPTEDSFNDYTLYREDGSQIETWADFQAYLDEIGATECLNSVFGEAKQVIEYSDYENHYMLVTPDKVEKGIPIITTYFMVVRFPIIAVNRLLNNGDNIYVYEDVNEETGATIPDYCYANYSGFHAFNVRDNEKYETKANAEQTYAKKSEVVDLASDQTIPGVKTISSQLKFGTSPNNYIDGSDNWITIRPASGAVRVVGDIRFQTSNTYSIGTPTNVAKVVHTNKISDGTNEVTVANLKAVVGEEIKNTTSTTISVIMASGKKYNYTQPITSVTISDFAVTTGDLNPSWLIQFKAGADIENITLPANTTWAYGSVGKIENGQAVKIIIEKGITDGTYTAYLVLA